MKTILLIPLGVILLALTDLVTARTVSYFIAGHGCGVQKPIVVIRQKPVDPSGLTCAWVIYKDDSEYDQDQMTIVSTASNENIACIELETDFPQQDLENQNNIQSPESCMLACQQLDGCLFFSYQYNNEICYMKHAKSSSSLKAGFISGPVSCHCDERDVLYEGQTIGIVQGLSSLDDCRAKCNQLFACAFYSLVLTNHDSGGLYQDGDCILSGSGAMKNVSVSRYISGPKNC